MTLARVAPSDLLTNALPGLGMLLPPGVGLSVSATDDLSFVTVDVAQVEDALRRLVANSAEAMKDREGQISVSAFDRTFDAQELPLLCPVDTPAAGSYVCISVSDQGHGMSADTLANAFDPFFSTRFTGRGLGLAAVHGIVKSLGGFVTAQSAEGKGSTLTLHLPAATRSVSG